MELAGIPIGALTPVGLVGVGVILIFTGLLVPRRNLRDVEHDRDEWRAEGRIKDQHIAELTEQNNILLREIGPTMTSFLRTFQPHRRDEES